MIQQSEEWYLDRIRRCYDNLKKAKYPGPINERLKYYRACLVKCKKSKIETQQTLNNVFGEVSK